MKIIKFLPIFFLPIFIGISYSIVLASDQEISDQLQIVNNESTQLIDHITDLKKNNKPSNQAYQIQVITSDHEVNIENDDLETGQIVRIYFIQDKQDLRIQISKKLETTIADNQLNAWQKQFQSKMKTDNIKQFNQQLQKLILAINQKIEGNSEHASLKIPNLNPIYQQREYQKKMLKQPVQPTNPGIYFGGWFILFMAIFGFGGIFFLVGVISMFATVHLAKGREFK